jgi:hypothetical protein
LASLFSLSTTFITDLHKRFKQLLPTLTSKQATTVGEWATFFHTDLFFALFVFVFESYSLTTYQVTHKIDLLSYVYDSLYKILRTVSLRIRILLFSSLTFKTQTKTFFLSFSAYCFLKVHLHNFSGSVHKTSRSGSRRPKNIRICNTVLCGS